MSEEIRKIALEFFKDKFGVMYNKQKELIEKLEEYSDYMVKVRKIQQDHSKRLKVLELAIKNSPPNSHLKEQINALKKKLDNFLFNDDHSKIAGAIAELKERLNRHVQCMHGESSEKKDSGGEQSDEVLRHHPVVDQEIKAGEWFDSVPDSKLPEPNMADGDGNPLIGRISGSAEPENTLTIDQFIHEVKTHDHLLIEEFLDDLESSLAYWNGMVHAKTAVVNDSIKKWQGRLEK